MTPDPSSQTENEQELRPNPNAPLVVEACKGLDGLKESVMIGEDQRVEWDCDSDFSRLNKPSTN